MLKPRPFNIIVTLSSWTRCTLARSSRISRHYLAGRARSWALMRSGGGAQLGGAQLGVRALEAPSELSGRDAARGLTEAALRWRRVASQSHLESLWQEKAFAANRPGEGFAGFWR